MSFVAVLLLGSSGRTEEPEQAAPSSALQSESKDTEAKNTTELPPRAASPESQNSSDQLEARRRAFSTGVVMLGGILICGVGLIAIVLLWGSRTRRIARQALPRVAPRDELWYLKHKVEADAERPPDRPANDDSTTRPND